MKSWYVKHHVKNHLITSTWGGESKKIVQLKMLPLSQHYVN